MCYIIAKKFEGHGCLALKTEYGRETAILVDYLGQKKERQVYRFCPSALKKRMGNTNHTRKPSRRKILYLLF